MSNYKYGDVLLWRDYKFDDGTVCEHNKLVVILSKPDSNSHCIHALTTSKLNPEIKEGCNDYPKTVFFIRKGSSQFIKNTTVQLYRAEIVCLDSFSSQISQVFHLEQNLIGQIKNCLKDSVDIYPEVRNLIK